MKSIIIYEGKYGATKQYAEWLAKTFRKTAYDAATITKRILLENDIIIIGSSVYFGKLLISKWLKQNEAILQNKQLFFFVVCGTPSTQKEKLQGIVNLSIPSSLSRHATIHFLRGRMIIKNLSRFDRLLLKMGAALTKDPIEKKEMLEDFDEVKEENMAVLINDLRAMTPNTKISA